MDRRGFIKCGVAGLATLTLSTKDAAAMPMLAGNIATAAIAVDSTVSSMLLAFNPADRSMALSLEGMDGKANLSVASAALGSVRSALSRAAGSGLVAFQVGVDNVTGTWAFGIANSAYQLDKPEGIGSDSHAFGFYVSTRPGQQPPQSAYFGNARLIAGSVSSANGSAASCIANFTTLQLWFSTPEMRAGGDGWNNSPDADPAAGTGGLSFSGMPGPYFAIFNTADAGSVASINGGNTPFDDFLTAYLAAHPSIPAWNEAKLNYTDAPGKDDSFMKRPFQAGAQWLKDGPAIVSLRHPGTAINVAENYGQPIYVSDASGQWVTLRDTSIGTTYQMHVPIGAIPAGGTDGHMTFFDTSRAPYMACLFRAVIANPDLEGGVSAATTEISCTDLQVDNAYDIVAEDRLTGQPGKDAGLGVIRNWHLAQALADPDFVIPNMLRWCGGVSQMYWDSTWATDDTTRLGPGGLPSIMWPLNFVDGNAATAYTGQCPAGATIGIPADTPRPIGQSRGFYVLFDMFQHFGAVWEDTGGNMGITLSAENIAPAYGDLLWDMSTQLDAVMQYVCILRNQTGLSTMKGGPGGANAFPAPPSLDTNSYGGPLTGGWLPGKQTGEHA